MQVLLATLFLLSSVSTNTFSKQRSAISPDNSVKPNAHCSFNSLATRPSLTLLPNRLRGGFQFPERIEDTDDRPAKIETEKEKQKRLEWEELNYIAWSAREEAFFQGRNDYLPPDKKLAAETERTKKLLQIRSVQARLDHGKITPEEARMRLMEPPQDFMNFNSSKDELNYLLDLHQKFENPQDRFASPPTSEVAP